MIGWPRPAAGPVCGPKNARLTSQAALPPLPLSALSDESPPSSVEPHAASARPAATAAAATRQLRVLRIMDPPWVGLLPSAASTDGSVRRKLAPARGPRGVRGSFATGVLRTCDLDHCSGRPASAFRCRV